MFSLLFLGGIALSAVALYYYRSKRAWLAHTMTTDGTVTRLAWRPEEPIPGYGRSQYPVVSFHPRGQTSPVEFESKYNQVIPPEVNAVVRVRYDSSNPFDAEIDGFGQKWTGVLFYGFAGGALLIGSVVANVLDII